MEKLPSGPFVSVVIPCLNESQRIAGCIEALVAQTYANLEIIIVDNNSTDRTAQVARSFAGVRVVKEKRPGIVFARDAGFRATRGEIIVRLDADTRLKPSWVENVVRIAQSKGLNKAWAITGPGDFYNAAGSKAHAKVHGLVYYQVNRLLLGHYLLWGSNMALSRTAWQLVGGNICDTQSIHEDMDLAAHLHQQKVPIYLENSMLASMELKRVESSPRELWHYLMKWARSLGWHNRLAGLLCYPLAVIVFLFGISVGRLLIFFQ